MDPAQLYHFGVYARIRDGQRVLLVRKTRGPYTGLLDLPGGRPEAGESWEEALERELSEELGVRVVVSGGFIEFDIHVERSSTGEPIDFHHCGAFTDVPPPTTASHATPSPDTAGAEWFDLGTGDTARLSAAVREVLGVD